MAVRVIGGERVYLGPLDLTGQVRSLSIDASRSIEDASVLGIATQISAATLMSMSASLECLWDETIDPQTLGADSSQVVPVTIAAGAATGDIVYSLAGPLSSQSYGGSAGDLMSVSVEAAVQAYCGRGRILAPLSARTTGGTGTAVQAGAVGAGRKAVLVVHVTSITGTGAALSVTLQSDDSSGFASPATQASVSSITAAGGFWAALSGPVTDTWWRVTWSLSGTSPSATFLAGIVFE